MGVEGLVVSRALVGENKEFVHCYSYLKMAYIDSSLIGRRDSVQLIIYYFLFFFLFSIFCVMQQPVGCDLQLNSDLKIDSCGVCGGDGSTCDPSAAQNNKSSETAVSYRWEFGHRLTTCTASCDGGKVHTLTSNHILMSIASRTSSRMMMTGS